MGIMFCPAAFKGNSTDRSREYRRRFACGFGRGDSSRRYLDDVAVTSQPIEQRAGLPLYALSSISSSNGRLPMISVAVRRRMILNSRRCFGLEGPGSPG
jgi:hypothetical protein